MTEEQENQEELKGLEDQPEVAAEEADDMQARTEVILDQFKNGELSPEEVVEQISEVVNPEKKEEFLEAVEEETEGMEDGDEIVAKVEELLVEEEEDTEKNAKVLEGGVDAGEEKTEKAARKLSPRQAAMLAKLKEFNDSETGGKAKKEAAKYAFAALIGSFAAGSAATGAVVYGGYRLGKYAFSKPGEGTNGTVNKIRSRNAKAVEKLSGKRAGLWDKMKNWRKERKKNADAKGEVKGKSGKAWGAAKAAGIAVLLGVPGLAVYGTYKAVTS